MDMDEQSSSSTECNRGDDREEQEEAGNQQQQRQEEQWCPHVGQRFRDPDTFLLEVKSFAKKQGGFYIGKSFTYDRNPSAVAKNGGIAPCPKGILYCSTLPGGCKKNANPCPWRLQFGYRSRTHDYEVTKLMDTHCCHELIAASDGSVEMEAKKLREQYAMGSAKTAVADDDFDKDWRPRVGERFTNPGHYLGMMRAWGQHDGFKVARSFSYTKTPSSVAANGGVEPIEKGIIYCSTLTGGVAKNACPCRVQFGWRSKTRDYEVTKVDTEHCHVLGNFETNGGGEASALPGVKQRSDSTKRAPQQQQQEEEPYVTAESARATAEWKPETGQRFLCPEQFVGIVGEYATRLGFSVAHSLTYSNKGKSLAKNGRVVEPPLVQKGIVYCNILEKTGEYSPCPFRINFNLRVKTRDYVVTKVSTSHCHTLNAASAICTFTTSASSISPPPSFAATATRIAADARHSVLMSRSEKICKLATTDASCSFLMAALGDLETRIKDFNKEEGSNSSRSTSVGQKNQAPPQLASNPARASAGAGANNRRSPSASLSGGTKRGRKTGNEDDSNNNHENHYHNSTTMDPPVGKQQKPSGGMAGWT